MAHEDFKDLTRTTASDKILRDRAFNIAKNPKYDRYQRGFALMVYKFFDKKISVGAATLTRSDTLASQNKSARKHGNISNKELAEEIYKPIIRKFKKREVHSPVINNIWVLILLICN